jgi:cell wall-associated NlpC family hydrolase
MRKILLVFFTALLCTGILGRQTSDTLKSAGDDSLGAVIADQHLGTPYRYGGKGPAGFDCSGFVRYCFSQTQGLTLSPSATYYYNHGIKVHPTSARPGDIICFTGSNSRNRNIGHVGIITEVTPTDIYFIHASVSKGIRYESMNSAYYKARFLQIRRVLN